MSNLDRLIAESEDAIKRLDALQSKRSILQRVKDHFRKNSAHLTNVLLAGSVLAVALGRLAQKQEHQADMEKWEAAQRRLEADKAAAEARANQLLASTEALAAGLEEAAGARHRDLPQIVRQQLADWRQRVGGAAEAEAAGGEGTAAGAAGAPGGSSGDGGDPKIMI